MNVVRSRRLLLLSAVLALLALTLPLVATADGDALELVPNTAVLLAKVAGGGGNGGNTSSASSATNIFAPASYVD